MARLPVLALVGRPNVGKSTLFNRLTRSRNAIVADIPGLTRDRQYGRGRSGEDRFIVIDSGGFEPVAKDGIAAEMARQTRQAIIEADFVIFVVDGREGLTRRDQEIANELRRAAAKPILAVNKTEGMQRAQVVSEFFELGLNEPIAISAAHGEGDILAIAVASTEELVQGSFTPPCHMCKQLLWESSLNSKLPMLIILSNQHGETKEVRLPEMISFPWPSE